MLWVGRYAQAVLLVGAWVSVIGYTVNFQKHEIGKLLYTGKNRSGTNGRIIPAQSRRHGTRG